MDDGLCSALGLEPAFRQVLGLGVGFKIQGKVNRNRNTLYVILAAPSSTHPDRPHASPHTPDPLHPYQTIPWRGSGTSGAYLYLTTCLPAYLPANMPTCLPPAYLRRYLPTYLASSLPPCLPTYLPTYLPNILSVFCVYIYIYTVSNVYSVYLVHICMCI